METSSKEFREYRKKLEALGKDLFPKVIAETLNVVAGFAHAQSIKNSRSRFVNRNQYTERSIRYYKASPKGNWTRINAVTGSISPYMDLQDTGGVKRPKRGRRVPIATLAARGGKAASVVRKRYKAGSLGPNQFVKIPKGGAKPMGVYERYARNKRLKMIRNLEDESVRIVGKRWHTDAVSAYAKRSVVEAEFARQAKRYIKGID